MGCNPKVMRGGGGRAPPPFSQQNFENILKTLLFKIKYCQNFDAGNVIIYGPRPTRQTARASPQTPYVKHPFSKKLPY